jgi:hypothetical protein
VPRTLNTSSLDSVTRLEVSSTGVTVKDGC